MVFRHRYYFEREQEKPGCRHTSGAAVRLADRTRLARHAAAIRAASLITNEPSVDVRPEDQCAAARPDGIPSDRTSAAVELRPRSSCIGRTETVVTCRRRPVRGAEAAD